MKQYIREPINSLTHLAGVILSVFGLFFMAGKVLAKSGSPLEIAIVMVFGISLILLYAASTTYHWVIADEKVIHFLRRVDHAMIFVLIAGTYAPYCLITLKGTARYTLFSVISILAIAGVIFKLVWFHCPRWISTFIYIGMGWMALFVFSPLAKSLEFGGLCLLILGGIFYTIGGIIYGAKPACLQFKQVGYHEIFHIFILLGSLSHFLSIYFYVI